VDDAPLVIDAGFAVMVTVGTAAETVTVAVAVTEPFAFVATAVYVVVAVGFTACIPPSVPRL